MATNYVAFVGKRIREAREAEDLSQRELAGLLPGKSDGTQISKWERGVHRPSDDTLEAIAKALKRDVSWFLAPPPDKSETPKLFDGAGPREAQQQLTEIRETIERLEEKVDKVLTEMRTRPEVAREVHRAFEDYASRLGREVGLRRPQSRRGEDRPPEASAAVA